MKKIYVSLYILLQIIVVGTAQQSTITVLDEDNKGLPFVNIHLLELDKYLHTDMDGKAIIVFGKFDSLQLEVTSIGYHKVNAVVYPNKDLVVSLKTNVVTLGGVVITGDRIFIIKLADGTYQKLIIEMLQGGVYTFKYADLDGENEVSASLTKSDYDGKNFGYYSIQNNTVLDREPVSPEWDLLFTKYVVDLGGGFLYGVSGVLANVNVQVAQANGVADVNNEPFEGQDFSFDIGIMGHDWKEFNMATYTYDIVEDVVYFVQTPNLDVYRVIFTGFGGSANGDFIFTQELVGNTVDIQNDLSQDNILSVYPTPATDIVNLTYVGSSDDTQVILTDRAGRQVYNTQLSSVNGMNQEFIDVSSLARGIYFLSVISGQKISTQKLVLN